MRIATSHAALLVLALAAVGCTPARYRGADDRQVAHGSISDAWTAEPVDGGSVFPMNDAATLPGEDAWVMPGHDAAVRLPDAATVQPDAWSSGSCPTYGGDVQPIYVNHCSNCHTTGSDPRFGSSYSIANRTSSSCGGTMAACTIELGRPGGSMARRDSLGGFNTAEIATIQSWIDCGRPM
jgi:hypothetical protein